MELIMGAAIIICINLFLLVFTIYSSTSRIVSQLMDIHVQIENISTNTNQLYDINSLFGGIVKELNLSTEELKLINISIRNIANQNRVNK